ncbi:MAG: class I SAM-dependent methyltransferase, partial [Bryobacteraceae bacterium]
MSYSSLARMLPGPLRRYVLHFEAAIESSVQSFASTAPRGVRVLDAGAGEARHAPQFAHTRYCAVDLAIGDASWNYRRLDAVADLAALPFPASAFDACLNIVTLEHVPEPLAVLREIARVLAPGGRLLLIVPHEWEVHQAPHDYYRYTRHGVEYLLARAGFTGVRIEPAGGFFRLLARRLLNGLQFFSGGLRWALFLTDVMIIVKAALM